MDILVLEDTDSKFDDLSRHLAEVLGLISIERVALLADFLGHVERKKFDMIIVDLLVPRFKDSIEAEDVTSEILDACRDVACTNRRTKVVALTAWDAASESNYKELNAADVSVLTFDSSGKWKDSLRQQCLQAKPKTTFEVVIICALSKEVEGFTNAGYNVEPAYVRGNLDCREMMIGAQRAVIVTAARMGLVSCAITATQAINEFSPDLICMSGICAGIKGKAKLLDIAIADNCHQHDFGKWSVNGYEPEVYSVPIKAQLRAQLKKIIEDERDFSATIVDQVEFDKDELPDEMKRLTAHVYFTPASSGSAVVADERMVDIIKEQQRKGSIFEMESFALYEAARLHPRDISFFSAKAVVDDGGASKGDHHHRLACILSAKTVYECIRRLNVNATRSQGR
jgi:nucleoside phosphorylase